MKNIAYAAFLFVLAPGCVAQISEAKAKDLVRDSECFRTFAPDPELSRITRNDELEDTILGLRVGASRQVGQVFIFDISNVGYFRTSSDDTIIVSSTGDRSGPLIAVSSTSGEVFNLHQCGNPERDFSRLIKDAPVRIATPVQAKLFALLRYKMVEDPRGTRLIVTAREFRHFAENILFGRLPKKEAKRRFEIWSRRYKPFEKDIVLGVRATPSAEGFSVLVNHLIGFRDGEAKLFETALEVTSSGEYSVRRVKQIYPK